MLERVNYFSNHIGLKINLSKTKVLSIHLLVGLAPALSGSIVEEVPVFKYLGSHLLPSGQAENEVDARIGSARLAFLQLRNALWLGREIGFKTKVRVYQTAVRPVLL